MASEKTVAGELRTPIIVEAPFSEEDGKGGEADTWRNVFGEGKSIHAKWKRKMTRFDSTVDNAKDDRVFASETAKVIIRYTKAVTSVCRVKRKGEDGGWWYIIGSPERSTDGGWLEFTAERRAAAL